MFAGYFQLGVVQAAHGLDGSLKIYLDTDRPEAYHGLDAFLVEEAGQLITYTVVALSPVDAQHVLVTTAEVLDRPTAEALGGCAIYLPDAALPERAASAFYNHEVIG